VILIRRYTGRLSEPLTTPKPNLLRLKKAQAIWRGILTAEFLKFPHRRSNVIKSLLETAKRLEKVAPEDCIAIQGQVIAVLSVWEVSQPKRTAYAPMRALTAMYGEASAVLPDIRQ